MKIKFTECFFMILIPAFALAEGPFLRGGNQLRIQEKQVEKKSPFKLEPSKDPKESIVLPKLEPNISKTKFDILIKSAIGTNSGGGGDSVINPITGKKKLLDLAEVDDWPQKTFIPVSKEYLRKYSENLYVDLGSGLNFWSLDYYWSDKVLLPQIQILAGIAGAGLTATLSNKHLVEYQELKRRLIETNNNELLKNLDQRIDKDGRVMRWIFVDFPLEEIDDEGVIRLVDASTKKQLAAQKNGIVAIQKQDFEQLDQDSQAALFLHEAFLFSTLNIRPDVLKDNGTSALRLFVKRFFDYEKLLISFYNDRKTVDEATLIYSHRSVEDAYKKLMKIDSQE